MKAIIQNDFTTNSPKHKNINQKVKKSVLNSQNFPILIILIYLIQSSKQVDLQVPTISYPVKQVKSPNLKKQNSTF